MIKIHLKSYFEKKKKQILAHVTFIHLNANEMHYVRIIDLRMWSLYITVTKKCFLGVCFVQKIILLNNIPILRE